ncbi:Hint domain-containing protein [Ketogulonicigenium vulgare]|uniref:Hint domain-containing protein n=1 Tax=Ketogulonicigenium vulgare TaxID=92945 RepID=UPI00235A2F81|nr:Hint domain-containing protein [Ketogulonicigenium vulgare]
MAYTGAIIFTGEHLARFTSQPTNQGNPGDANFAMVLTGARAIGTSSDTYRLVWYQNTGSQSTTDNFLNGQTWAIQTYNAANDPDGNPSVGEDGWTTAYTYSQMTPHPDLVAGLGSGTGYIVFSGNNGNWFILDINADFNTTAETLYYYGPVTPNSLTFTQVQAVCYLRGTMIMTDRGEMPIEQLREGDRVVTRFGGLREIKWIGRQQFRGNKTFGNEAIRFAPGSISQNMPQRSLYVSAGHSMLVGDVLVLAQDLINGVTVTRESSRDTWDYFQLDLGTHDLVLADGAWSEVFADCGTFRSKFDNAEDYRRRFPTNIAPLLPQFCLPRPNDGAALRNAIATVAQRALDKRGAEVMGRLDGQVEIIASPFRVEGWARDQDFPNQPVALEILLDGEVIGATLACLPQHGNASRTRQRFVFEGDAALTEAELRRVVVRRTLDGVVLNSQTADQMGQMRGHLDLVSATGVIEGWARDLEFTETPVTLEAWLDDSYLGTVTANKARRDLTANHGDCAFTLRLNRSFTAAEALRVTLRRVGNDAQLNRSVNTKVPQELAA